MRTSNLLGPKIWSYLSRASVWRLAPKLRRCPCYGASWGYGVWQLRHAGYDATGYEINRLRAEFGERELNAVIAADIADLSGLKFKYIFSNHVLEHLPNPATIVTESQLLLQNDGFLVAFFPNGSDAHRTARPKTYHHSWGRLHALYLDEQFFGHVLGNRPYLVTSNEYGQPPDATFVQEWDRTSVRIGDLSRPELMLIARFL